MEKKNIRKGRNIYKITTLTIVLKNPIVSGDFFLGMLIKGILHNENPKKYIKEASAFVTANCLNYFPEVKEKDYLEILKK